jgi:hypothetical protein
MFDYDSSSDIMDGCFILKEEPIENTTTTSRKPK